MSFASVIRPSSVPCSLRHVGAATSIGLGSLACRAGGLKVLAFAFRWFHRAPWAPCRLPWWAFCLVAVGLGTCSAVGVPAKFPSSPCIPVHTNSMQSHGRSMLATSLLSLPCPALSSSRAGQRYVPTTPSALWRCGRSATARRRCCWSRAATSCATSRWTAVSMQMGFPHYSKPTAVVFGQNLYSHLNTNLDFQPQHAVRCPSICWLFWVVLVWLGTQYTWQNFGCSQFWQFHSWHLWWGSAVLLGALVFL